jgi:hypothetical protein
MKLVHTGEFGEDQASKHEDQVRGPEECEKYMIYKLQFAISPTYQTSRPTAFAVQLFALYSVGIHYPVPQASPRVFTYPLNYTTTPKYIALQAFSLYIILYCSN